MGGHWSSLLTFLGLLNHPIKMIFESNTSFDIVSVLKRDLKMSNVLHEQPL